MMIINALQTPDTGTDASGMVVVSGVIVVAASATGAVALIITAIVRRAPSHSSEPAAGWYADPSREGTWRFWDGHCWTNSVA
ncbi:DUF2510 domain-containing protein [Pengzhenrongella sp.]|jgi:hypothetical protein|uniref:DUF2510 domain-containing protein n=1 Tax=Pengzhenrongella sp. TaxID=2888820 RepID=UPI0039C9C85B